MEMTSKVTSKGQITIPIEIRRRLGLKEGTVLDFDLESPFLKAIPAFDEDLMLSVLGSHPDLPPTEEFLDECRGKVDS